MALALGPAAAISQTPPPPPAAVEFFNPTLREHPLSATCGGGRASLAWAFDGQSATLRTFTLGGNSLPAEQLAQMQAWMSEIGGDVLIDLECGGNSASMRIINAQSAGSSMARMIRANLVDGDLVEFARYTSTDIGFRAVKIALTQNEPENARVMVLSTSREAR